MSAAVPLRHDAFNPDNEFVALLDGFRASGGLARAEDLAAQFRMRCMDAELRLARWIAHGDAVSIRWANSHWLPLFQFRWPDLELQPALHPTLGELRRIMTPWEIAQWFSEPNGWLYDRVPAEIISTHPLDVLDAARGDRFVLAG